MCLFCYTDWCFLDSTGSCFHCQLEVKALQNIRDQISILILKFNPITLCLFLVNMQGYLNHVVFTESIYLTFIKSAYFTVFKTHPLESFLQI